MAGKKRTETPEQRVSLAFIANARLTYSDLRRLSEEAKERWRVACGIAWDKGVTLSAMAEASEVSTEEVRRALGLRTDQVGRPKGRIR